MWCKKSKYVPIIVIPKPSPLNVSANTPKVKPPDVFSLLTSLIGLVLYPYAKVVGACVELSNGRQANVVYRVMNA